MENQAKKTPILKKIVKHLTHPRGLAKIFLNKYGYLITNDTTYTKLEYLINMKRWPNLEKPATYNEKLQWMKLHDHNEKYIEMVDKSLSKEYVNRVLGDEDHTIPTIGVWDKFDDIDFGSLPNQFVLKTTHDSGGVVIVKDKSTLDIAQAKADIEKSLNRDYYMQHREWPYKNVKRRIIAEKYMVDESGTELKDYKFFCFNGEPKFLFIATDRPFDTRFDFYDLEFNHLPFKQGHPWATKVIHKPQGFDEMIDIARRLSNGLEQVRVDLYNINGKIYFGELTLFHFSGCVPFEPAEWDKKIGDMWVMHDNH